MEQRHRAAVEVVPQLERRQRRRRLGVRVAPAAADRRICRARARRAPRAPSPAGPRTGTRTGRTGRPRRPPRGGGSSAPPTGTPRPRTAPSRASWTRAPAARGRRRPVGWCTRLSPARTWLPEAEQPLNQPPQAKLTPISGTKQE